MPRFDAATVGRYYDRHTPAFIAYGQGGGIGAIHRAVWGPGTRTRDDAFRYVEARVLEQVRRLEPTGDQRHVIDFGCGIGSSLCYLADQAPIRGTGITVSPVQARLAEQRVRAAGLADRVVCREGDFCALPTDIASADLGYAIESFVHGVAPARFFTECARVIRPGGRLVICDDFKRAVTTPAGIRATDRFREGWHINTLIDREALRTLAREAGFEHDTTIDLSPYLELGRPRDRVIDALAALLHWLPLQERFGHLTGGSALQTCLRAGWIGYDLALFRRLGARGESPRLPKTGEAPAWAGAKRENTGSIWPMSNAPRRDASPVEFSDTFTTGS